jgi:hypothetical protein
MTKPTGRPRGRPKTKEYVTIMARVPQDLADRVQRYAGRKRQTISDMVRDGLLALLQEDDPYRQFTSDTNTAQDIMSDTKGDEEEEEPPDAQPVIMSDTKEAVPYNMSDMNTEIASDTKEGNAYILSDSKEEQPVIVSDAKKARKRKRARRDNVSDTNAETGKAPDVKEGQPDILSDTKKARARKRAQRA